MSQPTQSDCSSLSRVRPKRSRDDDVFGEQLARLTANTDFAFAVTLFLEWLGGLALALWVSPRAWEGSRWSVHQHVWAAALLGGLIIVVPIVAVWRRPGTAFTRHCVAAGQMLMSALWIHLTGGRIETHFMVFGSLAFLAFYRDWKVLVTATIVLGVDHALRGVYFPESVYGTNSAPLWRTLEHVAWVVFEDVFLIYSIVRGNKVQQDAATDMVRGLGQYVLKERLGGGGMGEVYLAEHRLLKRPCAVKLVRKDRAHDAQTLSRFEREVQSMAGLTHPNTAAIYDYGNLEDGTFYYVMEYLHGVTLQELVQEHGSLSPPRVVFLLRQVCSALFEAHYGGLIHRDIKPDNILICQQGSQHDVAKLLDFGLVQSVIEEPSDTRLTQAGSILGTPDYMSPEQVSGQELDARSDLYSLGAVAYFLLTGRLPFSGKNALAVMYARLQESPERPSLHARDIPTDLEDVVLRCMSRSLDARFPDARSLEKALASCRCQAEWNEDHAAAWWKQFDPTRSNGSRTDEPATAMVTTEGISDLATPPTARR
jgi:serine/threonine protein kinase